MRSTFTDWALALAGSTVILIVLGGLFSVRPVQQISTRPKGAALSAGWLAEKTVAEAAQLMDPTPLFLPTALSAAHKPLIVNGVGDSVAPAAPPQYRFLAGDLRLPLNAPIQMPATPADALGVLPPGNPILGFGRTDEVAPSLPNRGATAQVREAGTGRVVLRSNLPEGIVPAGGWLPVEFDATVDAAGLVGRVVAAPRQAAGSPFPSLDAEALGRLENALDDRLFLGQRLAPGFYRIIVGP